MVVTAVVQTINSAKTLQHFGYYYNTRHSEAFEREDDPTPCLPSHSWEFLGDAMKQHQYCMKSFEIYENVDTTLVRNVYPNGRNVGRFGSFANFP